jgi:hypothetical protein
LIVARYPNHIRQFDVRLVRHMLFQSFGR